MDALLVLTSVGGLLAGWLATALYYEFRYGKGLREQRWFEYGLCRGRKE